jgi:propionyl-CoA synthetase
MLLAISSLSQGQRRLLRSSSTLLLRGFSATIQHVHGSVRGPHGSYGEEYTMSLQEPEKFWLRAAEKLEWFKKPTIAFEQDSANPFFYRWFPDGVMNTCYNCLDVHCRLGDENNRANQVALYYDSPLTGVKRQFTYQELLDRVSRFAGALQNLGVVAGDRVIIYMPMVPEAIIAMLACTRIGAVHSVVFGGFAAKELATRIRDCQPKVVISASAGIEPTRIVPYKPLLDKALELACVDSIRHTIIFQRTNVPEEAKCQFGPNDLDFDELMATSSPVDAVPLPANHTHYVLYTSGTTGTPKGVVRDTAGWATALKYSMGAFYDTDPGTVFWAASDIGWAVGHSYTVYAPLLNGCSTVLYEGKPVGTPDAGAFWRVIEEYRVRTLFVAPTAFRAIKQADPKAELVKKYDLSSLKAVFLAGEHSDPNTLRYCDRALSQYDGQAKAAIDHWWQTELGYPGVGNAIGLGRMPVRPGACSAPAPGFDIRIVDDSGRELPRGELGNMVIRVPLPPGTLQTLYEDDERYVSEYLTKYPGFYDTGDAAFVDEDGYVHILGRTDDLINTAGHRLSTGTIEELLQSHPEVAECAVIRVNDYLKGEVPVGFVVTNKGCTMEHEQLKQELIRIVREDLGAIASFKKVGVVKALPKTRSGKILRSTMSKIANDQPYSITPTIEDPDVFNYLEPEIIKTVRGPS